MITVSVLDISSRNDGKNVAVTFEIKSGDNSQREAFILSTALFADMGIRVGKCGQELYDEVRHASNVYAATRKGLNILSFNTCSKKMLSRKLQAKGFEKDIAQEAVEELCSRGYLDSKADALREADKCIKKLWGKKRMLATLYSKGYSNEDIRYVLEVFENLDVDYTDICAYRIREKYGKVPTDRAARGKLIASLMNYGFSMSEIRDAFECVDRF